MIRCDVRRWRQAAVLVLVAAACKGATDADGQLPLSVFAYDRTQPLDIQLTPHTGTSTALVRRISFVSPGGGRVTGLLAEPLTPGPFAGIVFLHGLPGNADGAMQTQGLELVARGAVAIAIDAPWVRRGGQPDLTVRDSAEQVQLIQDLQRAVDVLLTRTNVDPARLAYVGGSYGGAMGALFAGVERRLKAYVLFVPDGGLVAHFTSRDGAPEGPLAQLSPAARDAWLAAMRPIEPIRFLHRAPPAAVYIQSGRQDQLVDVDDAEALQAAARPPMTVTWYDADHGLTPQAKTDRHAWLSSRIGTAP